MKILMDERLKHRLVGLAVIISVGAIFAPAIMKKSNQRFDEKSSISIKLPPKPILPNIVMPEEKVMFNRVKVAHVNIDKANTNASKELAATIVKAESLSRENLPILASKQAANSAKAVVAALGKSQLPAAEQPIESKVTLPIEKKPASPKINIAKTNSLKNNYAVQLGTFSEQSNAISLVNRLKKRGFQASFNKIRGKNGVVYRVLVGQANEKQQAQKLRQQLASLTQLKGFVVSTGIS